MFCPNCGAEVRPEEKYCQSCGAALPQQTDVSAVQLPDPVAPEQTATSPAGPKLSYKEFITSPYCTPDVNKSIKTGWIILFICAALSAAVQIIQGAIPIDGILMAAIAVWVMRSKSFASGLTACIVGALELILTSIYMGKFAGWLPALAGVYALTATLKAKKQYEAYLKS